MMTLVFDLDQFVVDSHERAAVATQVGGGKIDWPTMFRGDLIRSLDQPIPAALTRLQELAGLGYIIWYVTSREEQACEAATKAWLEAHNYPFPHNVRCRPLRKGYKTPQFKADAVAEININREDSPAIYFGDDAEANRVAVASLEIAGLVVSEEWFKP